MVDSETFRELADHAPVMIWRAAPDNVREYFSRAWLDFTGRTPEQELGSGWTDGIHPEDRERCLGEIARAFAAQREFAIEYRLRRRDGSDAWVLDTGRPHLRGETFHGYLGSCLDVTDRREAAAQAKEALAECRRLLDEKEMLLAELHHRVRNSLQNTLSLISLSRRDAAPEHRPGLDGVERSVRAMALAQSAGLGLSVIGTVDFERYLRNLVEVLEGHAGLSLAFAARGPQRTLSAERAAAAGAAIAEYLIERRRRLGEDRAPPTLIELTEGGLRVSDAEPSPPPRGLAIAEAQARQAGAELLAEPGGVALRFGR